MTETNQSISFLQVKLTGKKAFLPACIECDTSMESVMAAWLVDAYHERYPSASGQKHKRSKVQQVNRFSMLLGF